MSESEQTSKMYKVLNWNAVAMWVYNNLGDTCSICNNPLNEACLSCQANQENFDPSQCKKVVGQCNHCFHNHCIEEWIKKQNTCPLDFTEWIQMKFID